ncbi:MAG: hypothetical protein FWF38_02130 [Spirochaetaceae bacterium]|nr:hypothetical protein [Spirochaetaceae bacterium]
MKKNILFLLLAFSVLSFGFGVDFGGYVGNYSLITSESDFREQINKLALWLALSPADAVYITGQGSVAYSYEEYDILGDLDYLYVTQDFSGFSYKLGRFFQSEFTGNVFSHRLDGAQFDLAFSRLNLMLGAGYSGLLLKPVSSLNNSKADMVDNSDDDIKFAPKKVIINLGASFPEIIPSQQLDFSVVTQIDMRSKDLIEDNDPADKEGKGGKFNTVYFGLGLSGALTGSFIYDIYGYLQLAKSLSLIEAEYLYKNQIAFLVGGSVSYLNKDFYFSKITASFMYASGDDDSASVYDGNTNDNNSQFIPVSESVTGIIFAPILSNLLRAGLEYSVKPFSSRVMKNFQIAISGAAYFKATEGAVSENRVSTGYSSEKYLGTEAMLTFNLRPFSDFGITAAGGAFFPNKSSDSPVYEEYRNVEPGVMINASFSF